MVDKESLVQHSYITSEIIQPTEQFPNNAHLPLLIYKGALLLKPDDQPDVIVNLFKQNGYANSWMGDVYDYDHFHTHTHEVLAVYCGTAEIVFGGEHGKCIEVIKGDVMIIPAGVAHKKQRSSDNFSCIGAYPDGRDFDVHKHEHSGDKEQIAKLPIPAKDPVYGTEDGHLHSFWK